MVIHCADMRSSQEGIPKAFYLRGKDAHEGPQALSYSYGTSNKAFQLA